MNQSSQHGRNTRRLRLQCSINFIELKDRNEAMHGGMDLVQAAMGAAGSQTHFNLNGIQVFLIHMSRGGRSRATSTCFRMNPRHRTAGHKMTSWCWEESRRRQRLLVVFPGSNICQQLCPQFSAWLWASWAMGSWEFHLILSRAGSYCQRSGCPGQRCQSHRRRWALPHGSGCCPQQRRCWSPQRCSGGRS